MAQGIKFPPPGPPGPPGSGPFGAGGVPGMKPPQPEDCPGCECTLCGCSEFVRVSTFKSISVLQLPPNGGHYEFAKVYCANCRYEFDLEKAKKWAFLSVEARLHAREQWVKSLEEKEAKKKGAGGNGTPVPS